MDTFGVNECFKAYTHYFHVQRQGGATTVAWIDSSIDLRWALASKRLHEMIKYLNGQQSEISM
jgi:hypothetical protein